jgi:hypothetical protein
LNVQRKSRRRHVRPVPSFLSSFPSP